MPLKTVCIIDDELSVRRATGALVRSLGWSADFFSSAESFLAAVDRSAYACLICDIELGATSGIDLQRRLRGMSDTTPMIFVTAHGTPRNVAQALADGAVCVLDKPVDPEALIAQLTRIMSPAER